MDRDTSHNSKQTSVSGSFRRLKQEGILQTGKPRQGKSQANKEIMGISGSVNRGGRGRVRPLKVASRAGDASVLATMGRKDRD